MALPAITPADFIGDIRLSQNSFRTDKLQSYIDFYYPQIISDLIGESALQEVEDAVTLPQKYIDLLSGTGVYLNIGLDANRKKPQLVEYAKRIIYFYWGRDYSINTTSGDAHNISENAKMLNTAQIQANVRQRYNWAIAQFNSHAIPFICNYTNYESDVTGVNDLGGGVLQILSPDTIYLSDGDEVTIGGQEYTISNLVDNTSFEITAAFSSTPTDYTYSPYDILVYERQHPVLF